MITKKASIDFTANDMQEIQELANYVQSTLRLVETRQVEPSELIKLFKAATSKPNIIKTAIKFI
jgi:hypothetical protein